MNARREGAGRRRCQLGLSYVEVLVATLILAGALVPALRALSGATGNAAILGEQSAQRRDRVSALEAVLAEPYAALLAAAAAANSPTTPTGYSDPPGSSNRRLVYIYFYDVANLDGDGDPFTIADPDSDADGNPFTGDEVAIELLWIQVATEGAGAGLETLTGLY